MLTMVAMLLLLVLAFCVAKPAKSLPPPVVALNLVSLQTIGTNVIATLSFTNMGHTEVYLWNSFQLWQLTAQTPALRMIQTAPFASVAGAGVPPGSNLAFEVPMPLETTQWQVTTIYGFQEKRHFPSEFRVWVWQSSFVRGSPAPIYSAVAWCLNLLPSAPRPTHGKVCTPIMTNEIHFP